MRPKIFARARARETSEFIQLLAEATTEVNLLVEIEAALQRLRHGTYGLCAATQQLIPDERLRALPRTRFTRAAVARRNAHASSRGET